MEISIVILSCVILGLNPEMPVFIRLIMICNLNGFRQIKYIHTSSGPDGSDAIHQSRQINMRL